MENLQTVEDSSHCYVEHMSTEYNKHVFCDCVNDVSEQEYISPFAKRVRDIVQSNMKRKIVQE